MKIDHCPKCGSTKKAWMERSMDGRSKCHDCGHIGLHTEWVPIEEDACLAQPCRSIAGKDMWYATFANHTDLSSGLLSKLSPQLISNASASFMVVHENEYKRVCYEIEALKTAINKLKSV